MGVVGLSAKSDDPLFPEITFEHIFSTRIQLNLENICIVTPSHHTGVMLPNSIINDKSLYLHRLVISGINTEVNQSSCMG